MIPAFEFATATRVVFGAGRLDEIGVLAGKLGRRPLVVTGRDPTRAQPLLDKLQDADLKTQVFAGKGEPELDTVCKGVTAARGAGCDSVIAFGGGSAIDTGKAIAAMLTNEGELTDFLEVIGRGQALTQPSAPFIAIPTTAGTGSEVTRNAVLAAPEHRVKVSLRSPFMLPRIALIDPELTYRLPPDITASTGLDALTQLIEPYVCAKPNPMTDALCVEGIRRAARALPQAVADGTNCEARQDMCIASLFGGLALANAGLGAVHGFAGPIGGMFAAPHGAVCAALLPHVMLANVSAARARQSDGETERRYETVARVLTGNSTASAQEGAHWVRRLVQNLAVPPLRAYGLRPDAVDSVVEKAIHASSMKANPIVLTREELSEILKLAI